jgi:protein gp37
MSEHTSIQWTHHTFNPWWGCAPVSAGCRYCYAMSKAAKYSPDTQWTRDGLRRHFPDKHWQEPLVWDRRAAKAGERRRVFCGSMCDWAEDRKELAPERDRLLALIHNTPHLDWLLLTKRAERLPALARRLPPGVWLGVTVEDQAAAEQRIPYLLQCPAAVRFVSVEPLLAPVSLRACGAPGHAVFADYLSGCDSRIGEDAGTLDWVICGGETGPRARPMPEIWAQHLLSQCLDAKVPFFFKQWGDNQPEKRTGRELCGQLWEQFPTPAAATVAKFQTVEPEQLELGFDLAKPGADRSVTQGHWQ